MTVSSPQSPQEHRLSAEQRRALELLATAGLNGCTGAALFARGFTIDMVADLIRDGLATARRETLKVGKRKITVARVWIADAGQRALEDRSGRIAAS
jgi:hypothetical protein